MKDFKVGDGPGVGRKVEQAAGQRLGLALPALHVLTQYPKELEKSKFVPGLPDCYAGIFVKA